MAVFKDVSRAGESASDASGPGVWQPCLFWDDQECTLPVNTQPKNGLAPTNALDFLLLVMVLARCGDLTNVLCTTPFKGVT